MKNQQAHLVRVAANGVVLDDSVVVPILRRLGDWPKPGEIRTCSELLRALGQIAGGPAGIVKVEGWPKRPRDLSNALRRLAPTLRRIGVFVEFGRETTGARRRWVTVRM